MVWYEHDFPASTPTSAIGSTVSDMFFFFLVTGGLGSNRTLPPCGRKGITYIHCAKTFTWTLQQVPKRWELRYHEAAPLGSVTIPLQGSWKISVIALVLGPPSKRVCTNSPTSERCLKHLLTTKTQKKNCFLGGVHLFLVMLEQQKMWKQNKHTLGCPPSQ